MAAALPRPSRSAKRKAEAQQQQQGSSSSYSSSTSSSSASSSASASSVWPSGPRCRRRRAVADAEEEAEEEEGGKKEEGGREEEENPVNYESKYEDEKENKTGSDMKEEYFQTPASSSSTSFYARFHCSAFSSSSLSSSSDPPHPPHCYLGELLKPSCLDPLHTHLSTFQRNAIAAFHAIGMSVEDIAKKTLIDKRTIKKWIDRAHENINLKDEARSGRPPKLKEEEKKLIFDAAKQHPRQATPPMLHHELQLSKLTAYRSSCYIILCSCLFYFPFL